uniref:Uncharacterized protein n=1 Tax=viral metagenome TaxID=1070528 RepID=A0A6M3LCB4_9ZZZZ
MHKEATRKGAPKIKHLGRTEARTKRRLLEYYGKRYPSKKIRNILKNGGTIPDAQSWAAKYGVIPMFLAIIEEYKEAGRI